MKRFRNQDLLEYIQSIFQQDYNRTICTKQTAEYRKDGINNDDMADAIKYWFEIKGNPTDAKVTNGGIGIVPYIINESRAYWKERRRLEAIAKENSKRKNSPQDTEEVTAQITSIKKPIGIYYFEID